MNEDIELERYRKVNKLTWILFLGIFSIVIIIYYIKPVFSMFNFYFLEQSTQIFLNTHHIKYDMFGCDEDLSGNCFYLYNGKIQNIVCEVSIINKYGVCYYP